jgi:uncharacterized protein YjcR
MEQEREQMGTDEVQPKMMTSAEVSEYLGVSLNTLQKWRSRNIGPKYVKYGGANSAAIRYYAEDLSKFKTAHTVRTRQGD